MNRKLKIVLISVASFVALAMIVGVLLFETLIYFFTLYEKVEIRSENLKESIYIKKETWGLAGSSQVVIVSQSPELRFEPDSTKDYIWPGFEPFLYKFENDTLFLYATRKSPVPDNWTSQITIQQLWFDNYDWMTRFRDSMEAKGLRSP